MSLSRTIVKFVILRISHPVNKFYMYFYSEIYNICTFYGQKF